MTLAITIGGVPFVQWTTAEVSRDLKDFAGSFSITVRDETRSLATFDFATAWAPARMRPGLPVQVSADGELVLDGYIKVVSPDIDEEHASVTISGEDKAGDMIDSAAAPEGPAEFKEVKLEEAVKRIAAPFGLAVRTEIDTGRPFPRYALDLGEAAFAAIEKGARQRHALVTSDGIGGIVITRTGARPAPAAITLPGNVKRASATFSHQGRHSETIVRGQAEKADRDRDERTASLTPGSVPAAPGGRQPGDGTATDRERRGTAMTGRARDPEITRHRPVVHLARTQPDDQSVKDEADWRMRTARAEAEEQNYVMRGHSANGRAWRVNEMAPVADRYLGVFRDLLISRVTFRAGEGEPDETELTVTSPEAFDKQPVGSRRTNLPASSGASNSASIGLDGTAEAL